MLFKRSLHLATVLVLAALFSTVSYAGHSWGTYHWARTTNPFNLQVIDSVSPNWDTELNTALFGNAALNGWADSEVLDLTIESANDNKNIRKRCPMATGKLRVCNERYGNNGWLGIATIGIDANSHIVEGTAQVNDSYASYWSIAGEKQHVMCQEIGHVFGLNHTSTDGSSQGTCMDYSQDLGSQGPNLHDFEQLASIYAHLDGYDSYATGGGGDGGGGDGGGCNAPPGKGCNKAEGGATPSMGVRIEKSANHEIWVAPRKAGGLWIRHVRLAPEGH